MNNEIISYENGIDFEVAPNTLEPKCMSAKDTINAILEFNDTPALANSTFQINDRAPLFDTSLAFTIHDGNDFLVQVSTDGEIEFGPNYKPDAAARILWDSIQHMMPVNKATRDLENLVKVQCDDGNYNYNEYMYGMANGMILALAILKNEEPQYLDRPERWQEDLPIRKRPIAATNLYGTQPECPEETISQDEYGPECDAAPTTHGNQLEGGYMEMDSTTERRAAYSRAMKGL